MGELHYWAVRTDRSKQNILFDELKSGRLRQGWGYEPRLDARIIKNKYDNAGWEALDKDERAAWPNLKFAGFLDGVRKGDIILTPNLPEDGRFCLVEVIGPYEFELREEWGDYGHVVPVRLLTPGGIHNHNGHVHADIRHTLRTRNRMWSLDSYKDHIERLLDAIVKGEKLHQATEADQLLAEALRRATKPIHASLWQQVTRVLQAAEWEKPLQAALSKIYPGTSVHHLGGPNEGGSDLLIEWANPFSSSGQPFVIPIQIKNFTGIHDDISALNQLAIAIENLRGNNIVLAAVVLSTADSFSSSFEMTRANLQDKARVPVLAASRSQLLDVLLAAHLAMRLPGDADAAGLED